jgi:hypothetical protein
LEAVTEELGRIQDRLINVGHRAPTAMLNRMPDCGDAPVSGRRPVRYPEW